MTAKREILFFFPEFNIQEWYTNDEIHYRAKENIEFNKDYCIHVHNSIDKG